MKALIFSFLFGVLTSTLFSQNISLKDISNQADYIIITVPEFAETCESFKKHKETVRGINVLITTKDQILTEFDDSDSEQENIRDFISYAATNWTEPTPEYFLFAASVDLIPNFKFVSIPNYPETDTSASDYFYGINKLGDDPTKVSLYVGRVSARNSQELQNYFNKVIHYESDQNVYGWNNTALYLADDGEPNGDGDIFEDMAFSISQQTPDFIISRFIFESESSRYYGTTDSVINYINTYGMSSLVFCGHGNNEQFTHEAMFSINDVANLQNTNKPFFVGYLFNQMFSKADTTSMLDQLLFSQNGSLGGVAPVGVSYAAPGKNLLSEIMPLVYNRLTFGEAFIETLSDFFGSNDEKKKYNIFGDPSIILKTNPVASVEGDLTEIPKSFLLHQNYPNPFNPMTQISFEIPEAGKVKLQVFDSLGRLIGDIINEDFNAGLHKVSFNGGSLASGVYYYKLNYNDKSETRKMLLLR